MHPSAVATLQNRVLLGWFAARSSEVGGVLLGKILPGKPERCVVVEDLQFVEPATQLFNTTDADRARLDAAISKTRTESELTPIGYFRSHIRPGLCLSPQDQGFIETNLRDPDDIFLLIKPNEIGVCAAAFFFWQRGQLQTEISDLKLVSISDESPVSDAPANEEGIAPQQPVPAMEARLAAVHPDPIERRGAEQAADPKSANALQDGVRASALQPAANTPEGTKARDTKPDNGKPAEAEPEPTTGGTPPSADATSTPEHHTVSYRPQAEKPQRGPILSAAHSVPPGPYAGSQRLNPLIWALACMLVAALCAAGYFALQSGWGRMQRGGSDRLKTDIGLHVEAVPGGQLNVSWNQDMPQLSQMQHAALTIVDGNVRRDLDIDNSQFRFGKLTYVPNSTDVQFQLEVFLHGNRSMAESVRVVVSAPQGGSFEAELVPPRVIERRRPDRMEAPKQRARLEASSRSAAPARFTAPVSRPITKRETDSTSLLSGITAPALPASPSHDLPPSVTASFSYVPPAKDVQPPATVQPFRTAQNTQLDQSTFIPPPNDGSHTARITRLENTAPAGAAGNAVPSHEPSSQSAPLNEPSLVQQTSSQAQSGAVYTPPVTVREVRPTVPIGLLGLINKEQSVEVLVNIDARGRVKEAQLVGSKGAISGLLSQSALDAARDYRFKPARHNGVAVASRLTITFRFVR
jgi:TonB family protein